MPSGTDGVWLDIWMRLGMIGALYALLFIGLEGARRRGVPGETTRKLGHVAGGLLALPLPALFSSVWPVVVLAAAFTLLLVATAGCGVLGSIHAIRRSSAGAFIFPAALASTFALAHEHLPAYTSASLALALGDSLAAFVGQRRGRHALPVWGRRKTVEGSLAAALMTTVATTLALAITTSDLVTLVTMAASVGLAVALTEAVSPWGLDNLTIPLAVLALFGLLGPGVLVGVAILGAAGLVAGAGRARVVGRLPDRHGLEPAIGTEING